MKKDNKVYLQDILNSINKIEIYVEGVTFNDFCEDTLIQDAVMRNLEVIGEAVKRLSDDFIKAHKDFPTRESVSMRNFLIHDYDVIDLETLWKTITTDLPSLKEQVEK